ncbi:hypothetical protein AAE02nite_42750 [Adhaeribacter aerolatus]|uniref:Homeodomain phBC6A51-type domain-containing protein n=1 Tax=Adhaeribacter aerolatus TaxID=670289 RepID=A0A512B3T1_9BACT|nr:hypothetical protein [Adhaeribacter aerolatus]GEO06611.1 hypothetical protein AAE02nite_42750 [Adhaeribacter aerolatus]
MKAKVKLSNAEKIKRAKQICLLYSSGEFTIKSSCEAVGVDYSTFQHWAQPHLTEEDLVLGKFRRGFVLDVHLLYKRSLIENNINYKLLLKNSARQSLLDRITGTEYEEVQKEENLNEMGKIIPVKIRRITKRSLPDVSAIIFALKSLDKENFQDKMTHSINGHISIYTGFEHLTLSELEDKKRELQDQLNSDNDC